MEARNGIWLLGEDVPADNFNARGIDMRRRRKRHHSEGECANSIAQSFRQPNRHFDSFQLNSDLDCAEFNWFVLWFGRIHRTQQFSALLQAVLLICGTVDGVRCVVFVSWSLFGSWSVLFESFWHEFEMFMQSERGEDFVYIRRLGARGAHINQSISKAASAFADFPRLGGYGYNQQLFPSKFFFC